MTECRASLSPSAVEYLNDNHITNRFHKELRKLYGFKGDVKVTEDDMRGPLVKFQRGNYRGFGARIYSKEDIAFIVVYRVYHKNKKRKKEQYEPEAYNKSVGLQQAVEGETSEIIQEYFIKELHKNRGFDLVCEN